VSRRAAEGRHLALFALMSTIWGTTFVAIQVGVTQVPPMQFAGTRFVAAGLALGAWVWWRFRRLRLTRADLRALATAAVVVIVGCYAPLFWGLQGVPSGFAAIVNQGMSPLALFLFGWWFGAERASWRRAAGLGMGLAGLAMMFQPSWAGVADAAAVSWPHLVAIVAGTLSYCLGSVLVGPTLATRPPTDVAAVTMTVGGLLLLALAPLFEPIGPAPGARPDGWAAALAAWLYLVLLGSLVAFTIYLGLIRAWGPFGAGLYNFVSPVIAAAVGVSLFDERLTPTQIVGAVTLLAASALVIRRARSKSEETPSP
jgi:drug/metabolite transporter (DMT)-like permease